MSRLGAVLKNLSSYSKPVYTTPFDAASEYTESAANRDYGNTLAGLTNQEVLTKSQYGFEDNSDPFSVSHELNRRYGNAKASTNTSFAAQGQLYSSARTGQQAQNDYTNQQATDQAQKSYAAKLADLAERRAGAGSLRSDTIAGARLGSAMAGTAAPLDPTLVRPTTRPTRPKRIALL